MADFSSANGHQGYIVQVGGAGTITNNAGFDITVNFNNNPPLYIAAGATRNVGGSWKITYINSAQHPVPYYPVHNHMSVSANSTLILLGNNDLRLA